MNEKLLIQFLTHTCLPDELRQVEQWISSEKANADWLFEMERVWSLKDELRFSDKREIEEAYSRFILNLTSTANFENAKPRFQPYFLLKYAAAVVIISLLSLNLYKLYDDASNAMNIIEVPNGQRVSITLSDGTNVELNSHSKFTYPSNFSRKTRNVHLVGEAFFQVKHDKKRPFIVNTSLLDVKVLGTKFNIHAYPNEHSVVTLVEGKVEVETANKKNKLTLKPNEQVTYSEKDGMLLTRDMDASITQSWTKGEAAFINKSLKVICRDLERKFDVSIEIADSLLANDVFNCRFKDSATIEQALILLKETRRLDYTFNGKHILIFKPKKMMPMRKH